jgi:hypothetical protein
MADLLFTTKFATNLCMSVGACFIVPIYARWLVDLKIRRGSLAKMRATRRRWRWRWRWPIPQWLTVCAVIGGSCLLVSAISVMWKRELLAAALGTLLLFPVGVAHIVASLAARAGYGLSCARCGYTMGSWRSAPAVCPECGRDWRRPWKQRWGHRRTSRWVLATGTGLVMVAGWALLLFFRSF